MAGADWTSARVHIEPRLQRPASPRSDFHAGATLVLVNVTVRDRSNRLVTSLDRGDFRLFENKVEQRVAYFSKDEAPVSAGLIFDSSGSMGRKVETARDAVAQLLKPANLDDEFFLIQFSDRPELIADFTPSGDGLMKGLLPVSHGRTSLLDGIYFGLEQMKHARNQRKALIIVSDGGDNHSRYSRSEILNLTRESDVEIYAIGLFEPLATRERSAATLQGPALLTELAQETGGRHYPVQKIRALPEVAEDIGFALRQQYLIGYTPTDLAPDGKYRKIQVSVMPSRDLRADWKRGYVAPAQQQRLVN